MNVEIIHKLFNRVKIQKAKSTIVVFTALIVLSFAVFAFAENNSSTDKNIFLDSDQDGLTNAEEKMYGTDPYKADTDGDGYSDGVEVRSGYDPLKPAPGDKIVKAGSGEVAGTASEKKDSKNLTDELSTKVTALMNQNSTGDKNIKMEDLDSIIQETTGNDLTFEDLPAIDESAIKIKKQDYSKLSEKDRTAKEKEDTLQYLTTISYIMANNSPQKISKTSDIENISSQITNAVQNFSFESGDLSFFTDMAGKGESILKQMNEVEVPQNMLDMHKRGLQLANYAISFKDQIKIDPQDPVKSMTYLSKLTGIISLSNSFAADVSSLMGKYGIDNIPLEL